MKPRAPSSNSKRDTFFCARCQTTFEERPPFCPNCDSAHKHSAELSHAGAMGFLFVLLIFALPALLLALTGYFYLARCFFVLFAVFGGLVSVPAMIANIRHLEQQFSRWQARQDDDER